MRSVRRRLTIYSTSFSHRVDADRQHADFLSSHILTTRGNVLRYSCVGNVTHFRESSLWQLVFVGYVVSSSNR